MLTRQK